MTREMLELVFISSALLGSAFLLLSSIGVAHMRLHLPVHVHLRIPHISTHPLDDAASWPMLLGFFAMFGIGGLFGVAAGAGMTVQVLLGLVFGLGAAALVFAIFSALVRVQGHEPTALRDLVGRRARVAVTIGGRARGTVQLMYDGSVQMLPATSEMALARGQEVVIVAVRGLAVVVRSLPPPP